MLIFEIDYCYYLPPRSVFFQYAWSYQHHLLDCVWLKLRPTIVYKRTKEQKLMLVFRWTNFYKSFWYWLNHQSLNTWKVIYLCIIITLTTSVKNKRPHNKLIITLVQVSLLLVSSIIVRTIWSSKLIRKSILVSAQQQPTSKNEFLPPSW